MPARIEDVAAHAGVSIKTVSRVINGYPSVRPALRARIEASVQALNYVPNASARSLAGNRSHLVALLYDTPSAGFNYAMELIVGVLQGCNETPYNVVLRPFELSDDTVALTENFVAKRCPDALILLPPYSNNTRLLKRLDDLGTRYATVSSKLRQSRIDVGFDEHRAAAEMVEHLISLGHRRIGHISGMKGHGALAWRLNGYRDALRKAGIAYDESLVTPGDFMFASGVAGAKALLDQRHPPTAIFAANDDMACGVIREAYERGLAVPHDLSVCGFDDTPMAALVSPSLTTVHQPCRELGRLAVEYVLQSIREPDMEQRIRVPYQLQLRASTASPGRR